MKIIVKPHTIQVLSSPVNEQEINVTTCLFEFSEEITEDFAKEAYFTLDDKTYKQIITNNQCEIPSEVLTKPGEIKIGVVAFNETQRYNPKPGYFTTMEGSLEDAENSQPITPSEMEQYETALQEGLNEIANVNIDAIKVGNISTITITDRTGTQKSVQVEDGEKGDAFTYDDFTPEQLEALRGPEGPAGKDGKDGTDGTNGIDGKDGKDGIDGTNGVDGYSPSASVSKSGTTATITITDKNGTTTATITDGTNGTDGRDGVGIPVGGTSGQLLAKTDATDYNVSWINPPTAIRTLSMATNYNVSSLDEGLYLTAGEAVTLNHETISAPYSNSFVLVVSSNTYMKLALVFNARNALNNNKDNIYPIKVFKGDDSSSFLSINLSNLADKDYVDNAIASAITTTLGGSY